MPAAPNRDTMSPSTRKAGAWLPLPLQGYGRALQQSGVKNARDLHSLSPKELRALQQGIGMSDAEFKGLLTIQPADGPEEVDEAATAAPEDEPVLAGERGGWGLAKDGRLAVMMLLFFGGCGLLFDIGAGLGIGGGTKGVYVAELTAPQLTSDSADDNAGEGGGAQSQGLLPPPPPPPPSMVAQLHKKMLADTSPHPLHGAEPPLHGALQPFQAYAGTAYGACPFADVEIVYVLADGAKEALFLQQSLASVEAFMPCAVKAVNLVMAGPYQTDRTAPSDRPDAAWLRAVAVPQSLQQRTHIHYETDAGMNVAMSMRGIGYKDPRAAIRNPEWELLQFWCAASSTTAPARHSTYAHGPRPPLPPTSILPAPFHRHARTPPSPPLLRPLLLAHQVRSVHDRRLVDSRDGHVGPHRPDSAAHV